MTPAWFSQPVPPLGAIKAEGIKNQLGRPDLDPLTVLVREAAQNSWDALDRDAGSSVRFALALETMSGARTAAWRNLLGARVPPSSSLSLSACLAEPQLDILFVGDRGTGGLGGPTRADATDERRHDYVSFVLNVGDEQDVDHGGGTYGFGKAVFYLGSRASTVLVHSRCRDVDGHPQTRLVGCALGRVFVADGRSFTGRHWFGEAVGEEFFEPIVGKEADDYAARLGFPQFERDELGTTVAVIAPHLHDRSPDEVCQRMSDVILWHLWPKMMPSADGAPSMTFEVSRDGRDFPIPDPRSHPVIREFADALRSLEERGELITYGSRAEPVGHLSLNTPLRPLPTLDDVAEEAGFGENVHHCCLLRVPELVVEYRRGPLPMDERAWYAGVFKALPEVDDIFALSEPPTHDGWVPTNLERRDKSIVQTTLRKIDEAMKRHAAPVVVPSENVDHIGGLAAASRKLGSLLNPSTGFGAGPVRSGKPSGGRKSRLRMVGDPHWIEHEGRFVLAQLFDVDAIRTVTAEALLKVRLWGGGASSEWDVQPTLIGWRRPDGEVRPAGRLAVEQPQSGRWAALIEAPPDTVVSVRVREAKEQVDA